MKPEMLVLDEPTAGLDPKGRDEILDLIAQMHSEQGMTVVLVSHSMEDVANYVQRIIVMHDGAVLYDDTAREVFGHCRELESVGLAVPQVYYLMQELYAQGLPTDSNATTVEEAKESILKMFR